MGWPVTSPVLFNQAKNSHDKALMAKLGQKHGHYLVLRRSCGVSNCLKIFFWDLDVMQRLSREILLRGDRRQGKEPQNRKQWNEVGCSSFSKVEEPSDGREDGLKVGVPTLHLGSRRQAPVHSTWQSLRRIWSSESRSHIYLEDY